jgi:hypothetical protein
VKPDRSIGDAIVDDVELERFIDWLCEHGHTPFSMAEHDLKEVWMLGLQAWHLNKCKNDRIGSAAYRVADPSDSRPWILMTERLPEPYQPIEFIGVVIRDQKGNWMVRTNKSKYRPLKEGK